MKKKVLFISSTGGHLNELLQLAPLFDKYDYNIITEKDKANEGLKEKYGKSLIIGIGSMFILQSIFNILMNLNLWMESNYNLPFVSDGGVNLIINLMCLSLVLSVYRKKDLIFMDKERKEKVAFKKI